jgi:hypothetical protein
MAHTAAHAGAPGARVRELADDAFRSFEAASNVTGLALGLVRYLDALEVCGVHGVVRDAARRRLDELTARGVPHRDFWPAAPASATAAEQTLPPAEYWRGRSASGSGNYPVPGDPSMEMRTSGSLLLRLSTIADFVPDFVARPAP